MILTQQLYKGLLCLLVTMGICRLTFAQDIQQVIAGSGGQSNAIGGYVIDFTVGEAVIQTAGNQPIYTQGFLQPPLANDFLPAALVLTAYARDTYVQVNWTTGAEVENNMFYIERSTDGFSFITIDSAHTQAPGGNSAVPLQYQYADLQPIDGIDGNNYYRIRQVDLNGNISYSGIVQVLFTQGKWNVRVFPNPVHNMLKIKFFSESNTNCTFQVFNLQGQVVIQRHTSFPKGYNNYTINMDMLEAGVYILKITDHFHGQVQAVKLVKN
jgi:hypothetical protein